MQVLQETYKHFNWRQPHCKSRKSQPKMFRMKTICLARNRSLLRYRLRHIHIHITDCVEAKFDWILASNSWLQFWVFTILIWIGKPEFPRTYSIQDKQDFWHSFEIITEIEAFLHLKYLSFKLCFYCTVLKGPALQLSFR